MVTEIVFQAVISTKRWFLELIKYLFPISIRIFKFVPDKDIFFRSYTFSDDFIFQFYNKYKMQHFLKVINFVVYLHKKLNMLITYLSQNKWFSSSSLKRENLWYAYYMDYLLYWRSVFGFYGPVLNETLGDLENKTDRACKINTFSPVGIIEYESIF